MSIRSELQGLGGDLAPGEGLGTSEGRVSPRREEDLRSDRARVQTSGQTRGLRRATKRFLSRSVTVFA